MTDKKRQLRYIFCQILCSPARLAEFFFFLTFFFTACVYYPGAMSTDSFAQYSQAVAGAYNDWHPPVMAFVWSMLLFFNDGPQLMLCLHLAILFVSLWLLYRHWSSVSRWAALFLVLPALPPVMIISGVIWKDVGLAFSLLSVYALVLYAGRCQKILRYALCTLAALMFVYAFMLRANALFACGPLLFYFFMQKFEKMRVLKSFLSSIAVLLLMVSSSMLFNYILKVDKCNPTRIMRVDEIATTSVMAGKNLFFPELGDVANLLLDEIPTVPVAKGWEFYQIIFRQSLGKEIDKEKILYDNWKYVITHYSGEYMRAKFHLFKYFLFKNWAVPFLYTAENDRELKDMEPRSTALRHIYVSMTDLPFPLYVIYAKLFWLTLAGGLFLYAAFPRTLLQQHIRALTSSGILYVLAYALVSPTPDYRFIYWTVLASLVSLVLFVMDRATLRCRAARPRAA